MKKLQLLILSFFILFVLSLPCYAVQIIVNEENVVFNPEAFITGQGITLVPMRQVLEKLDCKLDYISDQNIVAHRNGKSVYFSVDSNKITNAKGEITLVPTPIKRIGNFIFLPLRGISEAFQDSVVYENRVITINKYVEPEIQLPVSDTELLEGGTSSIPVEPLISILGEPEIARSVAKIFMNKMNPAYADIVDFYYDIAPKYGVRADIALAQACKETGYFKYGGIVKAEQNNFCGLAATGVATVGITNLRGADPTKVYFVEGGQGAFFIDRTTGVEAHIQHLFAYATISPLPLGTTLLSPRFTLVKRGCSPYVQYLGKADNIYSNYMSGWAVPGKGYGSSILNDYLAKMKM
ncbi:MAG: stalk domain-containing protein [Clostridia bacterium]